MSVITLDPGTPFAVMVERVTDNKKVRRKVILASPTSELDCSDIEKGVEYFSFVGDGDPVPVQGPRHNLSAGETVIRVGYADGIAVMPTLFFKAYMTASKYTPVDA